MLYLVPKIPNSLHSIPQSQQSISVSPDTPSYNQRFISDIQELSTNLFSFYAQDVRINVRCSMLLGLQDVLISQNEDFLVPMLVGNCPSIDSELLLEKAFESEHIQQLLMTRFYLNILDALLTFVNEGNAKGLILTLNDRNLECLEIFRPFITTESIVLSDNHEEHTKIIIPATCHTYDALTHYRKTIDHDIRQTLWRKQWGNANIREYLKAHALTDL